MSDSNTNTSTYGLFPFGTFIARSIEGENGSQSIPVSYEDIISDCKSIERIKHETFQLHCLRSEIKQDESFNLHE